MSFKSIISLITVVLLAIVVFFGRDEIVQAWKLLERVDIWILLFMVPVQLISYFANGSTLYSYLKAKGDVSELSRLKMMRISFELNFVNHIVPSGGVSGFSYLGWLLKKHKVPASRSIMAQMTRLVVYFMSFIIILILSVLYLALDGGINRTVLAFSILLAIMTIVGVFMLVFILEKKHYLVSFSGWFVKTANKIIRLVTFNKKRNVLDFDKVEHFFVELHHDYLAIKHDKKILLKPFLWAVVENVTDVGLISIAFLALGEWVSPAVLFIAYGLSAVISMIAVTPGGAGAYEAVMIAFMISSGMNASAAVAGTLLARVMLLMGTMIFGYALYQTTILKYGEKAVKQALDIDE